MKALILLILPAVLFAQLPKPGGGGGGGGSSTGSSNPSCTFASSATTCSIDVSSLNVTSANYKTILAECFTGASTTQTPVTITNYAYTTGSGIVQTVAPTFGAAAAAGYCAANGNGGAGPTGAPGATGATGPTGTTGAAGAGYLATSTTSLIISTGLKVFTTQAGLAYTAGAFVRVSSAANGNNYMQGLATSYSGTALTINVTETGGAGTLADWNINVVGNTGATGATGPNGPGYTATTTTSVTVSTGSKTVTTQAGLAYVVGSLVKIVSAATPANYVQGLATAYSGTSLTVNATETGGSGSFTDGNITIAGSTGPSGTGSGVVYAVDTGTANALVITPSPAITYTAGTSVLVKVAANSNAAATINANGLGVKKIRSSSDNQLSAGALVGGGTYLLVYNASFDSGAGAFELPGTGPCLANPAGFTCNAAGNFMTLTGETSGFRSYTTDLAGGNDSVVMVGYLYGTLPTSGNCAQWATHGGAPVLGQAAAPCGSGGGGTVTLQVNGSSAVSGSGSTLNLASSSGLSMTASNAGGIPTDTISPDTSILATRATAQSATDTTCVPVSGSPTAYTCVLPSPLTAYTSGMRMVLKPDVNCTAGTITLAIDGLSPARKLFAQDGSTNLTAAQCATTTQPLMIYDGTLDSGTGAWRVMTGGGGGGITALTGDVTASGSGSVVATTVKINGVAVTGTPSVGYVPTATSSTTATWQAAASGTPVAGVLLPYGGLNISTATAVQAANAVRYFEIYVPSPGIILNNITSYPGLFSADVGNMAYAVYNPSCSKIAQSATVAGTGGNGPVSFTFTPISLTGGMYFVGFASDDPATQMSIAAAETGASGYFTNTMNTGESGSTYPLFLGSNASSTSGGVTTLPSSCGTRTAPNPGDYFVPFFTLK